MEHSNNDAPKYPDTPPNLGGQDAYALLQRISSELASIKAVNNGKRSETARISLYSVFIGLLLAFTVYSAILQGNSIQNMENNQIKMKKTMKMLDTELSNEIQRMDDLLSGEILQDIPESSAAGNSIFVGLGKNSFRLMHKTGHFQPYQLAA